MEKSGAYITIEALTRALEKDAEVCALIIFGSAATGTVDRWSDVDALMVVEKSARDRFFPGLEWLSGVGDVYTVEQHPGSYNGVTRACFTDMRRLDVIVSTEAQLEEMDRWPSLPFADPNARKILILRSTRVERQLASAISKPPSSPPPESHLREMADAFWFRGVMAVTKVLRDDRLIALHLALEMAQDCLVLGMLLRDRAVGATHHHTGGMGNAMASTMRLSGLSASSSDILRLVESCAERFDELFQEWQPGAAARSEPLTRYIEVAREHLDTSSPRSGQTGNGAG